MHIPENYLSPATCGVMAVAMVPVWVNAVKKVRQKVPKEKLTLIGVLAAFSFIAMMFNVPLPGGTTGHAVGGTLIALILGPEAACIAVSIALLIQAVLFGDGGILAFGANCFNMAFVLPYVGYGVYSLIRKYAKSEGGELLAAGVGAYAGINAAAFVAALEFGIQPYIAHDAAGMALYCPYGLNIAIPSMMIGHLTLFGVVEVLFTVAVYAFVRRTSPGTIKTGEKTNLKPLYYLLGALLVLVPLGLLAEGTAWGEWGADEIAEVVTAGSALGYTPHAIANGFELSVLFPDYTMGGIPDWFAYILSAIIGVALSIVLFRVIGAGMKTKTDFGGGEDQPHMHTHV